MAVVPFTLPWIGEVGPYWIGVIGSLAAEVASAFKACSDIDGRCPDRYKRPAYLIFRALLALFSGALPVVLDAQNSLTAFYLGASAPLILDRLARGVKLGEGGAIPHDALFGPPAPRPTRSRRPS